MKVLIIEDEKAMSDLVAIKFKVEGLEAVQAGGFQEAEQKFTSAGPFDAILTDYLLPDGQLTDFLNWLRGSAGSKVIPILVMTNYIEDINQEQLKSLGVVEVMVKYQVVPAQMAEKIKQAIVSSKTGES